MIEPVGSDVGLPYDCLSDMAIAISWPQVQRVAGGGTTEKRDPLSWLLLAAFAFFCHATRDTAAVVPLMTIGFVSTHL